MNALCERVRCGTSLTGLLSGVSLHCLSCFTDYTNLFPVTQRTRKLIISFFYIYTYKIIIDWGKKTNLVASCAAFLKENVRLIVGLFCVLKNPLFAEYSALRFLRTEVTLIELAPSPPREPI